MKNQLLKKYSGMSLVEVMVVVALLGGLSLVAAQLMKNQKQIMTHSEAKNEELELYNQIRMILSKKDACENTFAGLVLGSTLSEIKNSDDQVAFKTDTEYGNRALEITSLKLSDLGDDDTTVPAGGGFGEAFLEVETKRLKKKAGQTDMKKPLMLQVQTNALDEVVECFSETSNTITTAKTEMCESIGGSYDSDNNLCDLSAAQIEAGGFCVDGNCRTNFQEQSCAEGEVMKGVLSDGTIECEEASYELDCMTKSETLSETDTWSYYKTVTCPTGYIATGGGVRPSHHDTWRVSHSYPIGENGWRGKQDKDSYRGKVYVRCCKK